MSTPTGTRGGGPSNEESTTLSKITGSGGSDFRQVTNEITKAANSGDLPSHYSGVAQAAQQAYDQLDPNTQKMFSRYPTLNSSVWDLCAQLWHISQNEGNDAAMNIVHNFIENVVSKTTSA